MINQLRLLTSLVLILDCVGFSGVAESLPSSEASSLPMLAMTRSLGKQFYTTIGAHDARRMAGFFIPLSLQDGAACAWIDAGAALQGAQVGYRRFLNQDWFIGAYVGYDVMRDLTSLRHLDIFSFLAYPARLDLGWEVSAARLGQLTVNFYGTAYNPITSPQAKDYFGTSAKLTFHHFPFNLSHRIKPFIGAAHAWVGLPKNDWKAEGLFSTIVGANYIVNKRIDVELKYVYDSRRCQCPLNAGLRIRFDEVNACVDYFRFKFERPPDRYIPHYGTSMQLKTLKVECPNDQTQENTVTSPYSVTEARGPMQKHQNRHLGKTNVGIVKPEYEDSIPISFDGSFFSPEDRHRADELAKRTGLNKFKRVPVNRFSTKTNNTEVEIEGGTSKEALKALWTDSTVQKNAVFTTQNSSRSGLGVGFLGSKASLLYGIQRTFKEAAEAAWQACVKNAALAKITQTTPTGETKTIFLFGFPSAIQADRQLIREERLANSTPRAIRRTSS